NQLGCYFGDQTEVEQVDFCFNVMPHVCLSNGGARSTSWRRRAPVQGRKARAQRRAAQLIRTLYSGSKPHSPAMALHGVTRADGYGVCGMSGRSAPPRTDMGGS